jgi:O-antigen/teichoic acid export membrane protein
MSLRVGITRLSIASVAPMSVFLLRFSRTVILSHMLSPNNLGACVAMMTLLAGCELLTDVGLDRFVIVNYGKDRAQAVAVAQQVALMRATFLLVAIAVFSPQLAGVFGAGEHLKGVAFLGLMPFAGAFFNWRLVQIQQEYRYGPEAIVAVSGQAAGVIMAYPAVAWFQDERAIVVILLSEVVVHVVLSNILVRREPVAYVDPAIRKAVIKWGIPLMINGAGLIAVKQLDQVIVSNLFDLKTLALYALSLNLAITPTAPLQAIGQKIGLPFLGSARADPQLSRQAALLTLMAAALVAAAYALGVGLLLDRMVPLLYGHQYQVTQGFCALAMFDAYLRFCRGGPNMILLHHGLTSRLTVGNLVAALGTLLGLALSLWSRRLESVMVGLVVGDIVSLVLLLFLLRRHLSVPTAIMHMGVQATALCLAGAAIWAGGDLTIGERVLVFIAGGLVIGIDAVVVFKQVGRDFIGRPGQSNQIVTRNMIPVPGGAAVASAVIRTEPPTVA